MPTHEEIIASAERIVSRELEGAMDDAMEQVFDLLESANYVVVDADDDWERVDQFFGFILKRLYANGECPDPFAKGGELE